MLFIMATGVPPIETPSDKDLRYRVIRQKGIVSLLKTWQMDHKIPRSLQDLLAQILRVKPNERLSLEKILAHPWMLQNSNMQQKKRDACNNYLHLDLDEQLSQDNPLKENDYIDKEEMLLLEMNEAKITPLGSPGVPTATLKRSLSFSKCYLDQRNNGREQATDHFSPQLKYKQTLEWPKFAAKNVLHGFYRDNQSPAQEDREYRPIVDQDHDPNFHFSHLRYGTQLCRYCLQWVDEKQCKRLVALPMQKNYTNNTQGCLKSRKVCDMCYAAIRGQSICYGGNTQDVRVA